MGRIPVFIYNDHPWIPYTGTDLDIRNYGYVARKSATVDTIPALLQQLAAATDEEIQQKQSALHKVRWYFTYPGIIYEIELFLLDPFGPYGGHLRCATHPVTESCCDS